MASKVLYRVSSVILVLYAAMHQLGFRQVDPSWHADATVTAMKTTFEVMGATRSYWDFFSGFGFFATGLLLFCAVLAWQLGGLPAELLNRLKVVRWVFAACFIGLTIVTWRYIFLAPTVFTALLALTLVLAAWRGTAAKS